MTSDIKVKLDTLLENSLQLSLEDKVTIFNWLSDMAYSLLELKHPILNVKLVPIHQIESNDYNPNHVAPPEFRLLAHSIREDGFTMPIVVADANQDSTLTIIDGYHRSQLIKNKPTIQASLSGYAPVVHLNKPLDKRITSSVRHNVARGLHQVELTAKLIVKLKNMQLSDEDIALELGMDKDEILRMQQVTGLIEAFQDSSFSEAWE